jgi:DNA-directed RNA polymerase subunit E'/Rpb7
MNRMNQMTVVRQFFEYPASQEPHTLLEHIRQTMERTCTKSHGFIIHVVRIIHVHSRKISIYNGNIIADCTVEVQHLLPQIGQWMDGVVKQTFAQGSIALVQDCMKVFLPNVRVQPSEIVQFRIVQIRFQKGRYDCIAERLSK